MTKSRKVTSKFKCIGCGMCCKYAAATGWALPNRDDGSCRYWDPDTRKCTIYATRPYVCRVDVMYDLYFDELPRDRFDALLLKHCIALRKIDGYGE